MLLIKGYTFLEEIYSNSVILVYRALDEASHQPVIIKYLRKEYPNLKDVKKIRKEYEMIKNLVIGGVVKALELREIGQSIALIFEDFGGQSLHSFKRFSLPQIFSIGIQISKILYEIHAMGLIHRDVKPSNIMFNPTTCEIKLTDFGIAIHQSDLRHRQDYLEGSLPYISPEQSGKTTVILDHRSDIYSFGITLYELCTGHVPFQFEDSQELVHAHIAKTPVSPEILNPEIPLILSKIIMKCLRKSADDRYQNMYGLQFDLEQAQQKADFELGAKDIPMKLKLPQKLYGREKDMADIYENLSHFLLIEGPAGIGKTSLIQEIKGFVLTKGGYFLSGKFDKFSQSIGYTAFLQIAHYLIHQLLGLEALERDRISVIIRDAISPNGQLLIDLLPDFELIIGSQEPVRELSSKESEHRLHYTLHQFLKCLSMFGHPLVLFLDDLQWADSASLQLIQYLLRNEQDSLFVIIGTYRGSEVLEDHPLALMLNQLHQDSILMNQLTLSHLSEATVLLYLRDVLYSDGEALQELASYIFKLTKGNPFFVREVLKRLYDEHMLYYDPPTYQWSWDLQKIETLQISNDVVDILINKFKKLSPICQDLLKLASCIGSEFQIDLLYQTAHFMFTHEEEIQKNIHEALIEDILMVFKEGNYKFLHDRVHQAIYSLISESDQKKFHLMIGQTLLELIPQDQLDDFLFSIVNHLNHGIELIHDDFEKDRLLQLNLTAAKRAKLAGSYVQALFHLKTGMTLLPGNAWELQYDLAKHYYLELAECEYLVTHFENADQLFHFLLTQLNETSEKIKVYMLMITLYTNQAQFQAVISTGLLGLRLLGMDVPRYPSKGRILFEIFKTNLLLKSNSFDTFSAFEHLEPISLPDQKLLCDFLGMMMISIYFVDKNFFLFMSQKALQLTLRYGYSAVSAWGFASNGFIQNFRLKNATSGKHYCDLIRKTIQDSYHHIANTALYGLSFHHWFYSLNEANDLIAQSYELGARQGELVFSSIAAGNLAINRILCGDYLENVEKEVLGLLAHTKQTRYTRMEQSISLIQSFIYFLTKKSSATDLTITLSNQDLAIDEMKIVEFFKLGETKIPLNWYSILKLRLFVIYNQPEQGWAFAKEYEYSHQDAFTLFSYKEHYFLLAMISAMRSVDLAASKETFLKCYHQFAKWAAYSPVNILHKYELLSAEYFRILGDTYRAQEHYEKAIEQAIQDGFLQDAALASERAGLLALQLGQKRIAHAFIEEALYFYLKWGAFSKINFMKTCYSELLSYSIGLKDIISQVHEPEKYASQHTTTSFLIDRNLLDFHAALKSAQAISREIQFDQLLEKLMLNIIEHSGSQKGFFIIKGQKKNEYFIKTRYDNESHGILIYQTSEVLACGDILATSIVSYSDLHQEIVLYNDFMTDTPFGDDSYIQHFKPKSILCLPVFYQTKIEGFIYLENNLMSEAFSKELLNILHILATQAGIAIENSKLYARLTSEMEATKKAQEMAEKSSQAKTRFLSVMSHELRTPIHAIKGIADVLLKRNDILKNPKILKPLTMMRQSIERLSSVIMDILAVQELEKKGTVHLTEFTLKELTQNLSFFIQEKISIKPIQFRFICDLSLDTLLYSDKARLRYTIEQLLNNAVSFTEKGEITLKIFLVNDRFYVEVMDTGLGIEASHLDLIFSPFSQVDQALSRKVQGAGLGLAICKNNIESLHGEITVHSKLHKGSTFKFWVPFQPLKHATLPHPENFEEKIEKIKDLTVLYCDDDVFNLAFLEMILKHKTHLDCFDNGPAAIQACLEQIYDLILLDIQMPQMDGIEVLKRIRALGNHYSKIPIIAITAQALPQDRENLLADGFDEYLAKPFKEEEFWEFLLKIVS